VVVTPEVLSFREFRAGLAGVLHRVRQSPDAAVFVGAHRRAEAVLVSVEQYEALQEAAERQHAVAAALAPVRAEGLEPSAEDLVLFAEVAAGRLSTDVPLPQVSSAAGTRTLIRPAACCATCWASPMRPNRPGRGGAVRVAADQPGTAAVARPV
jgi:PHD/YefM family antitoxin component YafN of YafNO toxin-antitoxin module